MKLLFFLLAGPFLVLIAGSAYRFFTLRSVGFPVVVRALPSPEGRRWRHGVLLFSDSYARFYKVRSILPWGDVLMPRHSIEIVSRRTAGTSDQGALHEGAGVLRIRVHDKDYEMAMSGDADTALVAWLESSPSTRRDPYSLFNKPRPLFRP